MQRLHAYPDIRAMFRRLLIATVTGVLAALAVAVFRHSMYLLEWLFLSNDSGSLVNARVGGSGCWAAALGMATVYRAAASRANRLYGSAGNRRRTV